MSKSKKKPNKGKPAETVRVTKAWMEVRIRDLERACERLTEERDNSDALWKDVKAKLAKAEEDAGEGLAAIEVGGEVLVGPAHNRPRSDAGVTALATWAHLVVDVGLGVVRRSRSGPTSTGVERVVRLTKERDEARGKVGVLVSKAAAYREERALFRTEVDELRGTLSTRLRELEATAKSAKEHGTFGWRQFERGRKVNHHLVQAMALIYEGNLDPAAAQPGKGGVR